MTETAAARWLDAAGEDATMDMGEDEFARRMMMEIKASARIFSYKRRDAK